MSPPINRWSVDDVQYAADNRDQIQNQLAQCVQGHATACVVSGCADRRVGGLRDHAAATTADTAAANPAVAIVLIVFFVIVIVTDFDADAKLAVEYAVAVAVEQCAVDSVEHCQYAQPAQLAAVTIVTAKQYQFHSAGQCSFPAG